MIPVLYAANATTFTSNGLGGLSDCISCTVTEERNGEYTLEMEYPESGLHYSDIALSCLIKVHCGDIRGAQVFRIYSITKPLNGRVKVLAQHISYQLSLIPVAPFSANSVASALQGLTDNAAETCPFTFWTNKATVADYTQTVPASIRSRLGGVQGSILDVYGGEYEFDMYTVKLWNSRGKNRGVTLRYGKNIIDLTQEENIANTVTGVYPFYSSDEAYVQLPEKTISAPSAANYPFPRTVPLDCSSQFQKNPPTEAQLRTYANSYISRSGIGVPRVNIKLNFANLRDTLEYQDMAALERVELCDTLTVVFEQLGVETTAKVARTTWDVLAERYNSIEVGDLKGSLASTIAETQEKANNAVTASALETAVNAASNLITGVAGGYIRLNRDADGNPYELLIMDQPDESTAVHVWRFNVNGWGYSSTGYAGPYSLAATIDGGIVADYITAGTLTGLIINNGNGTFYVDSAGQVTARSINITGGSVAIRGQTDETQIIQLDYYSGGSHVVGSSFMPSGVEVSGTSGGNSGIAKLLPGTVTAQKIYYDGGGNSQLRSAFLEPEWLFIADSATSATAKYDVPWYTQINKLYNTGTVSSGTGSSVSAANNAFTSVASASHATGTYLVTAYVSFAANATGTRSLVVTSSSSGTNAVTTSARARVAAVNGFETSFNSTFIITASASGMWYLRVWHNAGAALNVTAAVINAIKIRD